MIQNCGGEGTRPSGERIRIGSQLFINKDDTPGNVRQWVRLMKENHLEIIRLFMIWDQLETREGQWVFDNYDACFEQALECGMEVVPTLMSVSPPGWMGLTDGPQSIADLNDPAYMAQSREYIRQVVNRYKDYPNLHSWILWNEPSRTISRTVHANRAYADYVRACYADLEQYNRQVSYRQYKSFEELAEGPASGAGTSEAMFKSFAEQAEWRRFAVYDLNRQLKWIRDEIRQLDRCHPVHVNPHNLQMDMQGAGQSIWQESEIADFMGCSAHPVWHSVRFPERRWGQSVSFFSDLMKSATRAKDRYYWVTELQGGPTLYSAVQAYTPSGETISQWVWEGIGSGARAVVFWCFNFRTGGFEGGEWALLDQLGEPSPRLLAAKEAAQLLAQYGDWFTRSAAEPGKVMILYSERSWLLGALEGEGDDPANPRNKNMYADAMTGAYLMCSDLSVPVEFVNEERLASEGIPGHIDVFILPNTIVLGEQELEQLQAFADRGGLVIADGLAGMKDPAGNINACVCAQAESLFGSAVRDIDTGFEEETVIAAEGGLEIPAWQYCLDLKAGEEVRVAGHFPDGRPAVTIKETGSGKVLRIGTNFFQHYFSRPQEGLLAYFHRIIGGRMDSEITLLNRREKVRLKLLNHPDGAIVILLNNGREQEAVLSFRSEGRWIDAATKESVQVHAGQQLTISVGRNGVKLGIFKRVEG
ncbi:beta-galactosidase [Paenibacillus sp. YN15]|uniref:beta-galactosidase n=1 Tax=Paenibacillus sp. YN15 TaxID=1742774 RepID=UPI000DCEA8F4|nr:beta-galactosidase [Paenibacillus sp. YN15]RAU98919.1 hypothetical protein DQG13_16840 [Paenibacillus sp. YN15]